MLFNSGLVSAPEMDQASRNSSKSGAGSTLEEGPLTKIEMSWLLDSIEQSANSIDEEHLQDIALKVLRAFRSKQSFLKSSVSQRAGALLATLYDQLGQLEYSKKLATKSDLLPPKARLRTVYLRSKARRNLLALYYEAKSEFALDFEFNLTTSLQHIDAIALRGIREQVGRTPAHDGLQDASTNSTLKVNETALREVFSVSENNGNLSATLRDLEDGVREDIPWSELDWGAKEHIGEGSYGTVWRIHWGSIPIAVKVLRENTSPTELGCLKKLHHPNVVQLYGTTMETVKRSLVFVMELCDMSLSDYLHKRDPASCPVTLDFVKEVGSDVCSGLVFIFCQNFIHHDLQPAKILLKKISDRYHAKIGGFGVRPAEGSVNITRAGVASRRTIAYEAPEQLLGESLASPETNIYSLGIILWEMLERQKPWSCRSVEQIKNLVRNGSRPEFTDSATRTPESLKALIKRCWDTETKHRPLACKIWYVLKSTRSSNPTTPESLVNEGEAITGCSRTENVQSSSSNPAILTTPSKDASNSLTKSTVASTKSENVRHERFPPGRKKWVLAVVIILACIACIICIATVLAIILVPVPRQQSIQQSMQLLYSFSERPDHHGRSTVRSVATFQDLAANCTVRIVTGIVGEFVRIWSAADGSLIHTLNHRASVVAAYQDPTANNSMRIVSGSLSSIKIWSAVDGSLLRTIKNGTTALAIYRDPAANNVVRIVSVWTSIKIWSAADGSLLRTIGPASATELVTYLDPAANDTVRIVSSNSRWAEVIKVWSAADGTLLRKVKGNETLALVTYQDSGANNAVRIVVGNWDTIKIWSADSGRLLRTIDAGALSLATYRDPAANGAVRIISGSGYWAECVQIWSAADGALLRTLNHSDSISALATYPDPAANNTVRIISGSQDGKIVLWSAAEGSLLRTIRPNAIKRRFATYPDPTADSAVQIVSSASDGTVHIWSAANGSLLRTLTDGSSPVALDTYRDPEANNAVRIVTGALDGTVYIWSAADGNLLFGLKSHPGTGSVSSSGSVRAVAAYQDPAANNAVQILSVSEDGTVSVWSATDGSLLRTSNCPGYVKAVFQDPAANHAVRIVSVISDNAVAVCSAADGYLLQTLNDPFVSHVVTYPDPAANNAVRIVTGSRNGHVKVWSANDGSLLHILKDRYVSSTINALAAYQDPAANNAVRIIVGDQTSIKIWGAADGRLLLDRLGPRFHIACALATYQDPAANSAVRIIVSRCDGNITVWGGVLD